VPRLTAWLSIVAAAAALIAGCGGEDDPREEVSLRGRTITVWNNEHQPDRMAATREILADFTRRTGIRTKLVAVPGDGLPRLIAGSAPGGLAGVLLSTALNHAHAVAARGRGEAAGAHAGGGRVGGG